ncbi:MAG: tyrosine-type recombinase/integrase [Bacteroidetes bacterium]|nr:tyrosine-type recombinase/integrase [Bacteroidota bacterium]
MNLDALILPFIDYLKFEKRYSEHTIRSYRDDLAAFFEYLSQYSGELKLEEISSALIRSWLADLKNKQLSSRSINRKISTLKSFFRYQLKEGNLEQTPMNKIISPKISKRLPVYIEQKDMETLFSYVEFPDNWKGQTDRLLLEIFYNTGMRLSELIGIKESQIDFGNNAIKVLGKGNKERIIPISGDMMGSIRHYIKTKKQALEPISHDCLLVNDKGKKLYPKYVYLCVKQYLSAVTTVQQKSPHVLRHSFATHLTNSGAELNSIKELLGHASLAATQVYTHNTIEKLKDVYKKAHPKA